MGGHIIPEAEKVNTAVRDTSAGSLSTSYTFFPLCLLRLFQSLGKIGNLIDHHCWVLKNVQRFFFF